MNETHVTRSAKETIALGKKLAARLRPGDVVRLDGGLGAGKTTFVKGLALGLGHKKQSDVKSPTFVIMHIYPGRIPVYHFDLYRLEESKDLGAIGFEDFIDDESAVKCVEWAEKAEGLFPAETVTVGFRVTGENERTIRISGSGGPR